MNFNLLDSKAHLFHVATPTQPSSSSSSSSYSSSSSKASRKSQVGLQSHPTTNSTSLSSTRNPFHKHIFIDITKRIRASLSKPILLLRRKCLCYGKNSVEVNEKTPKPEILTTTATPLKPQNLSQNQIARSLVNQKTTTKDKLTMDHNQIGRPLSEGFTFPHILATTSPTRPQVVLNVVHEDEPPRDSLQAFQPPSPLKSRDMEEDAASDASSDLFEIESFSTHASTQACLTKPS